MTTFGGWLDQQASPEVNRQDAIGDLARAWLAAKGDRPRVFAPESVSAWVLAHLPEALHGAMRPAVAAYRAGRSGTVAPVDPPSDQQPGQPAAPGPPLPASDLPIAAAIIHALLPPLQAIEVRTRAILDWQAAQDKRIEPITRLLTELGMAEDQADGPELDERAHQAAEEYAATEGPPAGGSMWRNIAAPEPDFAAMAQDGDPQAGRAEEAGP